MGASKRAFRARLPPILTLQNRCFPARSTSFPWNMKICNLKIDVSCEASVNFHHISHISQNVTLATKSAPRRHLTQPCQCDSHKTRNRTPLKRCACHAKSRWTRPKCCACHKDCNASSENVAKVLRLPHKTTFDTLQKTSESHEVHAKRSKATLETSKSDPCCRTRHTHGHTALTRTVANGCGWLRTVADDCEHKRNVERTDPQPPDPQSETGTLAAFGKKH